jgi:gliding motility-associated-like protein
MFYAYLLLLLNTAYLFSVWSFLPVTEKLEEICDNALDDDGDGLIDLNDPDCDCPEVKPISLIPNPSFEENSCCPSNRSQLHCADTWIQASEATTDYLHTCGWMGWNHLPPPLPFPDGDACIGFRNGRFNNIVQPGWKEYTGACLTAPLRAGVSYRFEFYIGFTNAVNSPPINVTFFGSTDCKNLPFGLGDANYGCPTNGMGWKQLGSVLVSGVNQWREVTLTVTPTEDIYAIAIGPDCPSLTASGDIYYFFDNLILADSKAFEFEISTLEHPCSNNFTLQVPAYDTIRYQWYKDGVALVGETKSKLEVKTGEGNYVLRMLSPAACRITQAFAHRIPTYATQVSQVICKGESYKLNNQTLTKSGDYQTTFKTAQNCDSTVQLTLRVADEPADSVRVKIFEGEVFEIGRYRFDRVGTHRAILESSVGCDSLVLVNLQFYNIFMPTAFSPNGDGSNDVFTIFGNADLVQIKNLQIFNRWGNQLFEKQDFAPNDITLGWNGQFRGKDAPNGVYVYMVRLQMNDGKERQFSGSFTLMR